MCSQSASVAFVLAGALATSAVAWSRLLSSRSPSSREITEAPTVVLDWIDTRRAERRRVAIVPYAGYAYWGPNALLWWDVEFWNKSVDGVYVIDGTWDYAPFPHHTMHVDPTTGVIADTEDAPPLRRRGSHRRSPSPRGRGEEHATTGSTSSRSSVRTAPQWISTGLDPDGWTRPGRPASIHVFGDASANVSLLHGDGTATSVCGTATTSRFPTRRRAPRRRCRSGPTSVGTRSVGVRVTAVETRSSC